MGEDKLREEQLRIQAVGAAISRREWSEVERAYAAIRDEFDRRPKAATTLATLQDKLVEKDAEIAVLNAHLNSLALVVAGIEDLDDIEGFKRFLAKWETAIRHHAALTGESDG